VQRLPDFIPPSMKPGVKNGKGRRAVRGAPAARCSFCKMIEEAMEEAARKWPVYAADAPAEGKCRAIAALHRSRRKMLGLSVRRLAKKAGVAIQTVHNIETGSVWPRADRMFRIAQALQIDAFDYARALFLSMGRRMS
jgi:DNA-binding XRE family transcriptional regulator